MDNVKMHRPSKRARKAAKERLEEGRVCAMCGNTLFYTKKNSITCPFCGSINSVSREGRYGISFELSETE